MLKIIEIRTFDSGKWKQMEKVKDDVSQLVNLYERYKLLDNQVCHNTPKVITCECLGSAFKKWQKITQQTGSKLCRRRDRDIIQDQKMHSPFFLFCPSMGFVNNKLKFRIKKRRALIIQIFLLKIGFKIDSPFHVFAESKKAKAKIVSRS